jgi:Golgi phosphoprotein 3 GPP34
MATLTFADELALLTHDDEGVNKVSALNFGYGVGGALLVELALARRVEVADGRIVVIDPTPTGHPLVDDALGRIAADRARKPKDWVSALAKGLPDRVLDGLVAAGILTRDDGKVLWVFSRTRYPSPGGQEPPAETEVRARLDRAIRSSGPIDPRTAALLALVRATKFERSAFPDVPRDEMQAAILVTVIIPATIAATS